MSRGSRTTPRETSRRIGLTATRAWLEARDDEMDELEQVIDELRTATMPTDVDREAIWSKVRALVDRPASG